MRLEKLPFAVVFRNKSSGELCVQENKANAKLNKKRNDVYLAAGELIA